MSLKEDIAKIIINRAAAVQKIEPAAISEATEFVRELGIKSGNLVLIIGAIEDEYDCTLDFMAFRKCNTVGDAAAYAAEVIEG